MITLQIRCGWAWRVQAAGSHDVDRPRSVANGLQKRPSRANVAHQEIMKPADLLSVANAAAETAEQLDSDAQARQSGALVDLALVLDAAQEWHPQKGAASSQPHITDECSPLLRQHGLCAPELWQPPSSATRRPREQPFVFLHLSKCGGTSFMQALTKLGLDTISFGTVSGQRSFPPPTPSCSAARLSAKCCWWTEWLKRNSNNNASRRQVKVLELEPGNAHNALDGGRLVRYADPGFDAARDGCLDVAYAVVLRPPVERTHSHMCEAGANHSLWQRPDPRSNPLAIAKVTKQLRDNYYVRSLGGDEAWAAPEGGLRARHLLAAARALARFEVVLTLDSVATDAPVQLSRLGLAGFRWPHSFGRSRAENLQRASRSATLRSDSAGGVASCEVPPTAEQLSRLVAACAWDAVLFEFARVLAARRTRAYAVD